MSELSLTKKGGGGAKVYTEADCTYDGTLPGWYYPDGVTWGDIKEMVYTISLMSGETYRKNRTTGKLELLNTNNGNWRVESTQPAANSPAIIAIGTLYALILC